MKDEIKFLISVLIIPIIFTIIGIFIGGIIMGEPPSLNSALTYYNFGILLIAIFGFGIPSHYVCLKLFKL